MRGSQIVICRRSRRGFNLFKKLCCGGEKSISENERLDSKTFRFENGKKEKKKKRFQPPYGVSVFSSYDSAKVARLSSRGYTAVGWDTSTSWRRVLDCCRTSVSGCLATADFPSTLKNVSPCIHRHVSQSMHDSSTKRFLSLKGSIQQQIAAGVSHHSVSFLSSASLDAVHSTEL